MGTEPRHLAEVLEGALPVPWQPVAMFVALVFVAALIARFCPDRRRRLRHTFILFSLQLVTGAVAGLLDVGGAPTWVSMARAAADLLAVLTVINLGAITAFDLVLPALGVAVANIIVDLTIGGAWIVGFFHTLNSHVANVSSLVTTGAVISGVLSLALAPTIGNILGGVAIQVDGSIHEGDGIRLGDMEGKGREIHWRHTMIETRNWETMVVPNATLLSANVLILGKRAGKPLQRRYWVYFNVDFRHAPGQVLAVVNEALQAGPIPNVAADPAPHALLMDLAKDNRDSMGYYAVRYWLTDLLLDDPTNSVIRQRVHAALLRAGIPLAVPASTVFVSRDDEEHKQLKTTREIEHRAALLGRLEFFGDFKPEELRHLAQRLVQAPFAKGEVMTHQGRAAHWLYILAKGQGSVHLAKGSAGEKQVAILDAPNIFGEFAVMTGGVREATVLATEASECYRLDKDAFIKIMTERPALAKAVSLVMAKRRTELLAVRDSLDAEQRRHTLVEEGARLLSEVERFFGLHT